MENGRIEKLIKTPENYYAHLREAEGKVLRETLWEHTRLTYKYFMQLWEEKSVDKMLERFQKQLAEKLSQEGRDFWKKTIFNIPVYHDMGKINPAFQNTHMRNDQIKSAKALTNIIGNKHSLLSAVLYLDHYIKQLKNEVKDKEEKSLLRIFILLHSYVISRHHGDLRRFQDYLKLYRRLLERDGTDGK